MTPSSKPVTSRSIPSRHVLAGSLLGSLPLHEHDGPSPPPARGHERHADGQPLQEPDGQDEGGAGRRGLKGHSGGSRPRRPGHGIRPTTQTEGPGSDALLHPAPAHAQHDGEDQEGGGDGDGEGGEGQDGDVEPDEPVERARGVEEDVGGKLSQ